MKTAVSFYLLMILIVSRDISASENCLSLVKEILQNIDHKIAETVDLDQHIGQRLFVANYAKKNKIPVFMKQNQMGEDIPVILVNKKSTKKLANFIDNSYGTEVVLQPGYSNDHGLLRTGNFIIDVDAPGYRGYGELHKTGLAWKDFSSYTERRRADSGVIAGGGEHCFIFCKAQAVTSHIYELQQKLISMGLKNPDEFFLKPEIINRMNTLQEIILKTDPNSLNPDMISTKKLLESFNGFYPSEITTNEQKADFLRWAISYDSSKNYNRVLKDLGVSSDYGVGDARNKRVSAILVYDEGANPEEFNKGVYSAKGAFTAWPTGTQKPVE